MIDTAPLIAEITAAFDGVAREDGVSLREGIVLDDYGTEEERAAARLLDTDTRWQDVSDADLGNYSTSLSFFDAKGFRYYLPAYLIRDLKQNVDPKRGFHRRMLFDLRMPSDTRMRNYQLERLRLITSEQGKAICSFLKFSVVHGDQHTRQKAAAALADYWNRYCEGDAE